MRFDFYKLFFFFYVKWNLLSNFTGSPEIGFNITQTSMFLS